MTEAEFLTRVSQELKGLASNFVAIDYTNAISSAKEETGFTLPNTDNSQIYTMLLRTKRHMLYALWLQNATKFKIKQLNLDQKFDHLGALIKQMDQEFADIMADLSMSLGVAASSFFGTKIEAGFAYSTLTGTDLTYTDDNVVNITPSDENA